MPPCCPPEALPCPVQHILGPKTEGRPPSHVLSLPLHLPASSRLLSGQPGLPLRLPSLLDSSNTSLAAAAAQAGYPLAGDTVALAGVALRKGSVGSFVELHIEQGPLLEREGGGRRASHRLRVECGLVGMDAVW